MRLIRCVLLLLAAAPAAVSASTEAYGPQLVHLSIVDSETGRERSVYFHDGRYFVAGTQGRRYIIRLHNETDRRVLAIVSVDGINIISGTRGGNFDHGPVLAPYETRDMTGWLKNDDQVAVFRFSPMGNSYAARSGQPGNVGVIGLAVFEEKFVEPPPPPRSLNIAPPPIQSAPVPAPPPPIAIPAPPAPAQGNPTLTMAPPPIASAPAPTAKLGTAWGENAATHATWVHFERASKTPAEMRMIEYNSLGNLIADGIVPETTADEDRPNPFPDSPASHPHVQPPPP